MNFRQTMVAMVVVLFFIVFGFIAIEHTLFARYEMIQQANELTIKKSTVDFIIIDNNQQ